MPGKNTMSRAQALWVAGRISGRVIRNAIQTRAGSFRRWPDDGLLLSEPLALAEQRTDRLRRIYANAGRDLWDGPTVFREAIPQPKPLFARQEPRFP